jgi:plastocyanin
MSSRRIPLLALGLVLAGAATMGVAYVAGQSHGNRGFDQASNSNAGPQMMNGYGMGPWQIDPGSQPGNAGPQPGDAGFAPGTEASPRVVRIYALADDRFSPDTVTVQPGETITFLVTTMGPVEHEFMVGPAADVAADRDGTPEAADIGMMQTKSIMYTFDGSGPYAYACHEPGHYEAGMRGTIVVV